jgi:hypothetical protein
MSRAAQQEPTARRRELRVGQALLEIKIDPAAAPSQLFAFESALQGFAKVGVTVGD